jgi:hypothetical protein
VRRPAAAQAVHNSARAGAITPDWAAFWPVASNIYDNGPIFCGIINPAGDSLSELAIIAEGRIWGRSDHIVCTNYALLFTRAASPARTICAGGL